MPPTLTYPGVYIEELSSGVHTITGVATSIGAFVGWANQGPVDQAMLVQSWLDYEALYGGLDSDSPLGYAVNQFFSNGGQQAYIVRIGWSEDQPAAPGTAPMPYASALAAGLGTASAMIIATAGSVSGQGVLTVGTPVLQGVSIAPAQPASIPPGGTQQFAANWNNSDSSTTAPGTVTWHSSNPGVATINSTGLVSAVAPGQTVITVTSGVVSASVPVNVASVPLTGVVVTPVGSVANPVIVGINQKQQLRAVAQFADGSSQDVTNGAVWTTSLAAADATLSGTGLLTGIANGSGTVTATFGGQNQAQNVTVQAAVLSVGVLPANPVEILPAGPIAFTLEAAYSDKTSGTPPGVTWNSSNPGVATIDAGGNATLVAAGTTVLTATVTIAGTGLTFTASTTMTVKPTGTTITSVSLSPATSSVASGMSQQLSAMATFSDNTAADITGTATFTFTGGGTAPTISNPLAPGLATGHSTGAYTVTAALGGTTSAAVKFNVTAAVPVSIAVSPATAAVATGLTRTFTATVTMSDGTTNSTVTWSSSAPSVATVNAAGVATALASGGTLTLFAANPGAWGNNILVSIQSGSSGHLDAGFPGTEQRKCQGCRELRQPVAQS